MYSNSDWAASKKKQTDVCQSFNSEATESSEQDDKIKCRGQNTKNGFWLSCLLLCKLFQNCACMTFTVEGSIKKKRMVGTYFLYLSTAAQAGQWRMVTGCQSRLHYHEGTINPTLFGQFSKMAQLQNNVSCNTALIFPVNSLVPLLRYYYVLPSPFCKWNLPLKITIWICQQVMKYFHYKS